MLGLLGILLAVPWMGGPYQQPPAATTRQADAYAIYSIMMANLPAFQGADETYAISSTTKPAIGELFPGGPYPCIVPPPQYNGRWTEVLADFNERISKPATLVRELSISKPYMLITEDEVAAFQGARRFEGIPLRQGAVRPTPPPLDPKFQGLRQIFFLSDWYFNKDRSLALTGIVNWCGGLCASGQWRIYERNSNGIWVAVQPARDCRVDA